MGHVAVRDSCSRVAPARRHSALYLFESLSNSWDVLPALKNTSITSMAGIKRFLGGRSTGVFNGQTVKEVEVVLLRAGYKTDFSSTPCVKMSHRDRPRAE